MDIQKTAAICNPPLCNGVTKANKSEAAICNPPLCNGVSKGGARPRVELALADPLKVLALA
ncbi:MAG: hypothetical protein AAGA60_00080 [Cyanobacteria bacterium P01_E01_bin.42]